MHYCPESCREFLDETPIGGTRSDAGRGFHYRSAPIYLLTAAVGLIFGADLCIGLLEEAGISDWSEYRSVAGFRLALLAAVLGGARILYQTIENLFEGRIGADLALTIACLAAIVLREHTTAALVVFVALCGESIEGYTIDRAQRAIRGIFNLCPPTARILVDGEESEVPIEEIAVGGQIIVRPGERIAVDGKVIEGVSAVDQSALTGESLPVDREPGDAVFAGTLNQHGALTVEATVVGEGTTLARVVQLVAEATEKKAPLERAADRYARLFLPVVLGVALLTLIGWRIGTGDWSTGFLPALSVLVVACPCPLILATPSAVMAAMAWLARSGVVVKGSVALERLAKVDLIAFDKTGTLTRGELELGTVVTAAGVDETELLRTAAIAERRSEHPAARLICVEAEARGCVIPGVYSFESFPGFGVAAHVQRDVLGQSIAGLSNTAEHDGQSEILVGNARLLERRNIDIPSEFSGSLEEFDETGQTSMLIAVEGRVIGAVGVRDALREASRDVLSELQRDGVEQFALLTGDREAPARRISAELPQIGVVKAGLLPEEKSSWITDAEAAGACVAMVGDGVNDAPALATATVGVALGGVGSDVAAEAGDFVLMGDPLKPLPGLLRLSRQLVRTIRQSIYLFAFGMNGCGMVLGATGILSPAAAAIFHEAASLAVMLNALRLLWFERQSDSWSGRLVRFGGRSMEWAVENLSPSRLVFRFIVNVRLITRLGLACAALGWLLSGITLLTEDQRAVVTRFGTYEATVGAGMHWRWPAPFERLRIEQVDEVRVVQIGFRSDTDSVSSTEDFVFSGPIEWTSEHSGDEAAADSLEASVLTGDEVPVELTAEVHFRIGDVRQFVFASREPSRIVRVAAEAAIRQVVSKFSLDDVLTDARRTVESQILAETESTIERYEIGVEISGLSLLDVHPPERVVPFYRQVADAEELREQLINEAEAYYARTVLSAAGDEVIRRLSSSIDENEATSGSTTGQVANWSLSDDLWLDMITPGPNGQLALSGEAAARIHLAGQEKVRRVEQAKGAAARFEFLESEHRRHPNMTSTVLYFNTITESLAGRPLTIVDPEVAGRQRILLLNPEEFSSPTILQPMLDQTDEEQFVPENSRSTSTEFDTE